MPVRAPGWWPAHGNLARWPISLLLQAPTAPVFLCESSLGPHLLTALWMHVLLLQVRPMCQELFQLPQSQLLVVQAGALLATALVMAANQRTLLQRYLDRALAGKQGCCYSSDPLLLPATAVQINAPPPCRLAPAEARYAGSSGQEG